MNRWKIADYNFTAIEAERADYIFNSLRQSFPCIKIDERSEITGIGEEGYRLMCYFIMQGNSVYAKFKFRKQIPLLCDIAEIDRAIESVTKTFLSNRESFVLSKNDRINDRNGNETCHARSAQSDNKDSAPRIFTYSLTLPDINELKKQLFCREYAIKSYNDVTEKCINELDQECRSLQIEYCASEKLNKSLLPAGVTTINDLIALNAEELMKIRGFGLKRLEEAKALLNNILEHGTDVPRYSYESPDAHTEAKTINLSETIESVNDKISDNIIKFTRTYTAINNFIYQIATKFYSERDAMIFAERYLAADTPTLEKIGNKYGLTRERIRQLCNRSARILTAQLTKKAPCVNKYEILKDIGTKNYFSFMIYCKNKVRLYITIFSKMPFLIL